MQKSRLKDAQANQVKLYCIEEARQWMLENPMAKKYGTFEDQTRINLEIIIKKTSYR